MIPALSAALTVFCLALWLFQRERRRSRTNQNVARRLASLSRETPLVTQDSLLREERYSQIPRLNEILARIRTTRDLEQLVKHAGIRARVGELVLWMALIGMVGAAVAFTVSRNPLLAAGVFVFVGPGLGFWWLQRRRRLRRGLLTAELPDALDMIRSSLQAGHGLNHALEMVADEAPEPLAGEIRQVLEELRLGHPIKDALDGIYQRTGIEDLRFFSIAVLLNREIGGNLSEIIDVVASTIRERFKLKAQVSALTAQGRMSAAVLTGLPPVLMVLLSFLNPEYLRPLYHTVLGRFMLGYCAVSTLLGYVLMRRIVDIKIINTD